MSKIVNIGVIGAGRIGQVHAENLANRVSDAAVSAIADMNLGAAQKIAGTLQIPTVTHNYHDLLDDKRIDAIVICSSTDTHAQIIEEAAIAKKHIFCEKPVDLALPKIDRALAAVKRAEVKLQVGFNRRFDTNAAAIREQIAAGKIGQVHLVRIVSRDPAPPPLEYVRVSGGLFLDMTIHDFDMARFLAGSEVTEVFAAGANLVDPQIGAAGDVDTAVITLRFANGAMGVIDNSRKAVYGYDQRMEVFGSMGAVEAGNRTPNAVYLSNDGGVHYAKPLYFFMERYVESFLAEMRAFIAAVKEDRPVLVGGDDGRMAVVIGLAAHKSHKENRPVKLSEISG
jgi:myo-inositol 2-dehydrogenase/D-chiro-inositol 1-dehydrogenase